MLLSPYLHPKLRSLTVELYKSPLTNVRCTLAYIPSLVGVVSIWAAILLCCSNVVQVPLSLNPFQLNLEFGTTHRVQMCYTSKQV